MSKKSYGAILVTLSLLLLFFLSTQKDSQERLDRAYQEYKRGEKATTLGERQEAFNRALALYSEIEEDSSAPDLLYNIGNSYFQLGRYTWAILYYSKTLSAMPSHSKAQQNLAVAKAKLGLSETEKNGVIPIQLPVTHALLWQFLAATTFAATLFASLMVWSSGLWLKRGLFLALSALCLFLAIIGYRHYIAPVEGIVVESSVLYRDAGFQYAKVIEDPIPSGSKVEILELLDEGRWLKIYTEEGQLGYVPYQAIRKI